VTIEHEGCRERGNHFLCHPTCILRFSQAGKDDREFVPAKAADNVRGSHTLLQPPGRLDEQLVTGGVTEVVIDVLEMIQIDEQAPHATADAVRMRYELRQTTVQHVPVRQPGQRIVLRKISKLLLGTLAFGDIAANSTVTFEPAIPRKKRHAAHADVIQVLIFYGATILEVVKGLPRLDKRPILPPRARQRSDSGSLPERFAER